LGPETNTHREIDPALVGAPVELSEGKAVAKLETRGRMAADDQGLVHGGFVFGLADYAAMLAVNDPLVVLGSAETKFVAPVKVGDEVVATAVVTEHKGKKHVVDVKCLVGDREVLTGTFTCFVLDQHVLA
jgi:acyl-coenzyme A thioesterase PaaI-like protein